MGDLMNSKIGTMKESSLHASLKSRYSKRGGDVEQNIKQYQIDIVNNGELIEIQTGNFSHLRGKLKTLLPDYSIKLVYPVPINRWIVRIDPQGKKISRRKSPKKGNYLDIFNELIYVYQFTENINFVVDLLLINDELVYIEDGKGSWRRKGWSVFDRVLLEVIEEKTCNNPSDYFELLPIDLPRRFTARQLAEFCQIRTRLAQRTVYSLYHMGEIMRIDKEGNAWVYERRIK